MYARVTMVQGSPEQTDAGIESYNSQVLPAIQGLDGYKGSMLLVDRSTGKGIGLSLWATEDARRQAADAVAKAREATVKAMGGTVPPVDEYEVAVSDLR